jgi:hypothetical protein
MSEQINSGQVEEQKTPEASGLLLSVDPLEPRSLKLSAGDDSGIDKSTDGGADTGDESSDSDGSDSSDTDLTDSISDGSDTGDGSGDSSDSDGSDDSGLTEIKIDSKDA